MKVHQITIRELLLLTTIVALSVAWIVSQVRSSIRTGMLQSHIVDLELINEQYRTAVTREGYALYFSGDGPFLVKMKQPSP